MRHYCRLCPTKKVYRYWIWGAVRAAIFSILRKKGHHAIGLDGSYEFCEMAKSLTGLLVLQQDFLKLDLPEQFVDGIFANASLFHVPSQEMIRVLKQLRSALKPQGVLFSSNPRGNSEGWQGDRYGTYLELATYQLLLESAGFEIIRHYYRPQGLPCAAQPWLADCQSESGLIGFRRDAVTSWFTLAR